MPVFLYYFPESIACRSVLMLIHAIDIDVILVKVNVAESENMTPEFLAMNPTHTLPTLNDDGLILWESRAILIYLATKYGDSILYPIDPERQAGVNKMLFFDCGTLFQRYADYFYPKFFKGADLDEEKHEKCHEALAWFDKMLERKIYVTGKNLTVADYALLATFCTYDAIDLFDLSEYPNALRWYETCKEEVPGYKNIVDGLENFKEMIN